MPRALPQTKLDAIQTRLAEQKDYNYIVEELNVSIQTVKNYSTTLRHHGVLKLPSISKMGRPPALTQAMINVLIPNAQSEFLFIIPH